MSLLTAANRPNSNSRSEGQFRRSRERIVHISQSFVPIRDEEGEIIGFSPVNRDAFGKPSGITFNRGRNAAKRAARN